MLGEKGTDGLAQFKVTTNHQFVKKKKTTQYLPSAIKQAMPVLWKFVSNSYSYCIITATL